MMSVPAINSVLPPSGSQSSKISTSPTANPSVSPLGLSVPPKLSVIPPPQIPSSPSKPPIGVNHSAVPLSLVFENKVVGSQSQAQSSFPKTLSEKPKDLSPTKPTSNGVETSKTPPQNPPMQAFSSVSNNKNEEASSQQTTVNHTEERISTSQNQPIPVVEEPSQSSTTQAINTTPEKSEESLNENASKADDKTEIKPSNETKSPKEDLATEVKVKKTEAKTAPSSQPVKRKREQKPEEKKESETTPEKKTRRIRSQVLPYQSPLPELATFINKSLKEKDSSQKNNDEKLIVFYRNEFLALRNADGGFYLCQTLQNVYRSSHRIRIRWLSHDKEKSNDEGDMYSPDFYDFTDFECILTTVALRKKDKNMYKLPKIELERIENILKRALDVEKGVTEKVSVTEEHPDGIDLSLYKDESQLQKPKKGTKRKSSSSERRKSPKKVKKEKTGGDEKEETSKKGKSKNRFRTSKKVTKITSDKGKTKKRGGTRFESKSSKAIEQTKVSPSNEKARLAAKVLYKVEIVSAKDASKKQAKSKTGKRVQESVKVQNKNAGKSGIKKGNQKSELSQSHHERRQGKNKYSNIKNKK